MCIFHESNVTHFETKSVVGMKINGRILVCVLNCVGPRTYIYFLFVPRGERLPTP